jgi:hypothetical protein
LRARHFMAVLVRKTSPNIARAPSILARHSRLRSSSVPIPLPCQASATERAISHRWLFCAFARIASPMTACSPPPPGNTSRAILPAWFASIRWLSLGGESSFIVPRKRLRRASPDRLRMYVCNETASCGRIARTVMHSPRREEKVQAWATSAALFMARSRPASQAGRCPRNRASTAVWRREPSLDRERHRLRRCADESQPRRVEREGLTNAEPDVASHPSRAQMKVSLARMSGIWRTGTVSRGI